jgi:hypothetical protein
LPVSQLKLKLTFCSVFKDHSALFLKLLTAPFCGAI